MTATGPREGRKAPESVMRDLCEAVDRYFGKAIHSDVANELRAYRAATAPLRTRASVDGEIVNIVRSHRGGTLISPLHAAQLDRLCSEPTAGEPTCYPTTAGCHWCGKVAPVTPVGWDNICAECLARGEKPSGSSSTPAAKESRDNAGVSAGPTNEPLEDPEPCGCEEGDALKRKLADIRTEHDLWRWSNKSAADSMRALGLILKGP